MRKLFLWLIVLVVVALAAMPAVAYAAHSGSPPGEIVATAMAELDCGVTTATAPDADCGRRQTLAVLAIAALTMIAGSALTLTSRTTRTHLRDGGWSLSSA